MISVLWQFRRYYGYAALLLACGWLWLSKNNTEKELFKTKAEFVSLESVVRTQNEQIAALELAGKTQAEIAKKAMAEAKKAGETHERKAQKIMVSVPKSNDDYTATMKLLEEYGR